MTIDPAGLTRPHWSEIYELVTTAKLQAGLDQLSAGVLDMLSHIMARVDNVAVGGVVSGLVVSNVAGTMNVSISAGLGFAPNTSALLTDPAASRYSLLLAREASVLALDPGDLLDRIDTVYAVPAESGADQQAIRYYKDGVGPWSSKLAYQRMQNAPSFTVAKGTPGSGVAGAPPAGAVSLATVLVPAGASSLDTATLADVRGLLGRLGESGQVVCWAAGRFTGVPSSPAFIGNALNVASISKITTGFYHVLFGNPVPARATPIVTATAFHMTLAPAPAYVYPAQAMAYCATADRAIVVCFDHTGTALDPFLVNLRVDLVYP